MVVVGAATVMPPVATGGDDEAGLSSLVDEPPQGVLVPRIGGPLLSTIPYLVVFFVRRYCRKNQSSVWGRGQQQQQAPQQQ